MSNSERVIKGILGTKLGMTQLWDENNKVVPVTVIQAGPCVVTQVRTPEKDGYNAVQLGFGAIPSRKVTKPAQGHFDKADVTPRRHLLELRTALNGHEIAQALRYAVENHASEFRMGQFSAAEHNCHFNLIALFDKAKRIFQLDIKVMLVNVRTQLDLFDAKGLLLLFGFFFTLLLLITKLPKVHDAADGRLCLRRNLDQVEMLLLRHA